MIEANFLGKRTPKIGYAANVWDLQAFENRLYIGHGNSSNSFPMPNAGPCSIIGYVPAENRFFTANTIINKLSGQIRNVADEQQIDKFLILDGNLVIPGHDAREPGYTGSFYRLENNRWFKYQTIPGAAHVYDMIIYENKLFAALGTGNQPTVVVSEDNGLTWRILGTIDSYGNRAYSLFILGGNLYAAGLLVAGHAYQNVLEISPYLNTASVRVYGELMFPNFRFNYWPFTKMDRITQVTAGMMYIAGEPYNDHQIDPQGIFLATGINEASKITFPQLGAVPVDILTRPDATYILTYVKYPDRYYTMLVYKTTDFTEWQELFRFKYETYAMSFEEIGGDFYFGTAATTDQTVSWNYTGHLLTVRQSDYSPPPPSHTPIQTPEQPE